VLRDAAGGAARRTRKRSSARVRSRQTAPRENGINRISEIVARVASVRQRRGDGGAASASNNAAFWSEKRAPLCAAAREIRRQFNIVSYHRAGVVAYSVAWRNASGGKNMYRIIRTRQNSSSIKPREIVNNGSAMAASNITTSTGMTTAAQQQHGVTARAPPYAVIIAHRRGWHTAVILRIAHVRHNRYHLIARCAATHACAASVKRIGGSVLSIVA